MPGEELITYLPKKKVPIRNKGKKRFFRVYEFKVISISKNKIKKNRKTINL